MLKNKPKVGEQVRHPVHGKCTVKIVYDENSKKEPGTLALESEDCRRAFDAHARDLHDIPPPRAPRRHREC